MKQLIIKNGMVVATHEMHQDVRGLYPGCEIVSYGGTIDVGFAVAGPTPDPRTEEEKKQAYKDKRRLEYPGIAEQLDMIYHDAMGGTTTWKDAITAVKVKHPKPDDDEQ
jgi:hypothetical protein